MSVEKELGKGEGSDEFACEVRSVFSGDDLVLMVNLGVENLWKRQRVRLHGVDTPNAVNQPDTTEAGRVRREVAMLTRDRAARIRVVSKTPNSWIVVLTVETPGGTLVLNDHLLAQGFKFGRKKIIEG